MIPLCMSQRCHALCMSQRCHCHSCAYYISAIDTTVQLTLSNIYVNDTKQCFYAEILLGCTQHCCDIQSSIIETAVTCTAVLMTSLRLAQWCQWHRCDMHSSQWHRCNFWPHMQEALATLKGNIYQKNIHSHIVLHYIFNFHSKNMGVIKGLCTEWGSTGSFQPEAWVWL
jgi:hypothetical protein